MMNQSCQIQIINSQNVGRQQTHIIFNLIKMEKLFGALVVIVRILILKPKKLKFLDVIKPHDQISIEKLDVKLRIFDQTCQIYT